MNMSGPGTWEVGVWKNGGIEKKHWVEERLYLKDWVEKGHVNFKECKGGQCE